MININLRIAGLEEESIVDGPGLRYVIFTQGCIHNCEGCHNPESHDFNGGSLLTEEEIIKMKETVNSNKLLDGITLSGGDPFEQPEACYKLLKELTEERKDLNVIIYSGYTLEQLEKRFEKDPVGFIFTRKLLSLADTLIDGKYINDERSLSFRFRGSANQREIKIDRLKYA